MHPHNYYLEILTETGLIRFFNLLFIFIYFIYLLFKKYFQTHLKIHIIIHLFFIFIEIFPLKSTGSFFTTGNTTYIISYNGILIGISNKKSIE